MLCKDQLISGQECGGITKKDLTTNHQNTDCQHGECQHGEMMTGTVNTNTANTAAAGATYSIHSGATVNFNQFSTPHGQ